jgi:alkylated DNA nucleotide flippase Atl1
LLEVEGDHQTARRSWEDAAAVARTIGDRHTLGMALAGLGYLARLRGDLKQAAALFGECLALGKELGPSWRVLPRAVGGLAGVAALAGDSVRSARLFGVAESLWNASGKRDMPWWRVIFDADTTTLRAALGDGRFAEALAEGRAMRLEEALAYASDTAPTKREQFLRQDNLAVVDARAIREPLFKRPVGGDACWAGG